jgi:hypothetical protein
VSSYGRRAGTAVEKVESLAGISPAPRRVTETGAERLMRSYLGPPHKTRSQAERSDWQRQYLTALREGDTAKVAELRSSGHLTAQQAARGAKVAKTSATLMNFRRLALPDALTVYEHMDPEERATVRTALSRKFVSAQIPSAERPAMRGRMQRARQLPVGVH